jgi:hypothetical protein
MNDMGNKKSNIKNCSDCKPADMDCQISVECKRQRREKRSALCEANSNAVLGDVDERLHERYHNDFIKWNRNNRIYGTGDVFMWLISTKEGNECLDWLQVKRANLA